MTSAAQIPPVEGVNGQVHFDGHFVTITRKGLLARSTIGKGDKRLPLTAIVSVKWKPAGLVRGFIQFETASVGGTRSWAGRQSTDAAKDENSVLFNTKQQPAFEQLRATIEQALAARHAPQSQVAAPVSVADELTKLAQLRDQGVLSPAEFEQQKVRLLGS